MPRIMRYARNNTIHYRRKIAMISIISIHPVLTRAVTTWLVSLGLAGSAAAQTNADFPTRSIEVIVPYAAGGGVDAMARTFAEAASRELNQPLVILNREGAGGVVGFMNLARAKPDGYTIAFSPASPMTNAPFVNANLPFHNTQIEPVCQVFENVFAIAVTQSSPLASFNDLMTAARAAPGRLSYGHAGLASIAHLSVALIERDSGVQFNQVPYRGDSQALPALMSGALDFAALGVGTLAGKNLRVLAVLSPDRHPALPDVPSVTEFGASANVSQGLNGIYLPVGAPREIIARYEDVCRNVVASEAFTQRAQAQSQVLQFLDAKAFQARIEKTYAVHQNLVPGLGLDKN